MHVDLQLAQTICLHTNDGDFVSILFHLTHSRTFIIDAATTAVVAIYIYF